MKNVAENLRKYRQAKHLTQEQTAKHLHIDRTTYNKYEAGVVVPPLEAVVVLCALFDITPNDLLGWTHP